MSVSSDGGGLPSNSMRTLTPTYGGGIPDVEQVFVPSPVQRIIQALHPVLEMEAAEIILAGQVFRPAIDGRAVLAQADYINNCQAVYIAANSGLTGDPITVAGPFASLGDWTAATGAQNLVIGTKYFLSPFVAGALTTTIPNQPGQVMKTVGIAVGLKSMSIRRLDPIIL
jgi:hypothetical protein